MTKTYVLIVLRWFLTGIEVTFFPLEPHTVLCGQIALAKGFRENSRSSTEDSSSERAGSVCLLKVLKFWCSVSRAEAPAVWSLLFTPSSQGRTKDEGSLLPTS